MNKFLHIGMNLVLQLFTWGTFYIYIYLFNGDIFMIYVFPLIYSIFYHIVFFIIFTIKREPTERDYKIQMFICTIFNFLIGMVSSIIIYNIKSSNIFYDSTGSFAGLFTLFFAIIFTMSFIVINRIISFFNTSKR